MSDFFRPSHPAHSLQLAFYTLVPFYGLAVLSFLWLARALKDDARRGGITVTIACWIAALVIVVSRLGPCQRAQTGLPS